MRLVAAALGVALLIGGSACGKTSDGNDTPGPVTRVVLAPTSEISTQNLDLAVEIIRKRLDDLGVRDTSVKRQDKTIEVIARVSLIVRCRSSVGAACSSSTTSRETSRRFHPTNRAFPARPASDWKRGPALSSSPAGRRCATARASMTDHLH
jgi:hypothetical protein